MNNTEGSINAAGTIAAVSGADGAGVTDNGAVAGSVGMLGGESSLDVAQVLPPLSSEKPTIDSMAELMGGGCDWCVALWVSAC